MSIIPSIEEIQELLTLSENELIEEVVIETLMEKVKLKLGCGYYPSVATCPSYEIKNAIEGARILIEQKSLHLDEIWLHHVNLRDVQEDDLKQVLRHVSRMVKQYRLI